MREAITSASACTTEDLGRVRVVCSIPLSCAHKLLLLPSIATALLLDTSYEFIFLVNARFHLHKVLVCFLFFILKIFLSDVITLSCYRVF